MPRAGGYGCRRGAGSRRPRERYARSDIPRPRGGACRARHPPGTSRMISYDYIRDGAAIYERSFATIREEADLARFSPGEADIAIRMIHACGQVEAARHFEFSPG